MTKIVPNEATPYTVAAASVPGQLLHWEVRHWDWPVRRFLSRGAAERYAARRNADPSQDDLDILADPTGLGM
jgi:hypothetical protein